jgi:hypothetical protein
MSMHSETLRKEINLWVSGNAHPNTEGVDPDILRSIQEGWVKFLEQKFNHKVEIINPEDPSILRAAEKINCPE